MLLCIPYRRLRGHRHTMGLCRSGYRVVGRGVIEAAGRGTAATTPRPDPATSPPGLAWRGLAVGGAVQLLAFLLTTPNKVKTSIGWLSSFDLPWASKTKS